MRGHNYSDFDGSFRSECFCCYPLDSVAVSVAAVVGGYWVACRLVTWDSCGAQAIASDSILNPIAALMESTERFPFAASSVVGSAFVASVAAASAAEPAVA